MILRVFNVGSRPGRRWWRILAAVPLLWLPAMHLVAQEAGLEDLPTERHLAAALSDPESRLDTLMTMVAVERLLDYGAMSHPADIKPLSARFKDERAWLDRLGRHYPELPIRAAHLDLSAWFLSTELDQLQVTAIDPVSPLGPEHARLLDRLFDRSDERLSAAVLPEALHGMESRSIGLWQRLLNLASSNEALLAIALELNGDWFDPWGAAEPPAPGPNDATSAAIEGAVDSLVALVAESTLDGPPDALRLKRLRFTLLSAIPSLDEDRARDAAQLLALADAVAGLERKAYLAFVETLLWVVSEQLLTPVSGVEGSGQPATENDVSAEVESADRVATDGETETDADAVNETASAAWKSPVPRALSEILPGLSNAYASEFAGVDPRLNAALATVFDAVQYLQGEHTDPERQFALKRGIADTLAQFVLLMPEMAYYYDQPVRRRLSREIDTCMSVAAGQSAAGATPMSREQFDRCMNSLVEMATDLAAREELAGDSDGPFAAEHLRRELMLPAPQRINYVLGYLYEHYPTGCEPGDDPLPNPLEWATLANMIAWFARQTPGYFRAPENELLLVRVRQQGLDLLRGLHRQVDCISGSAAGIDDPVVRSLADYRMALEGLVSGLREAELEFREARLKAGADVVLHADASQRTAYRNEDLSIGPCDPARICEMAGELEPTRALIGLFPDPYLIADQTRMGRIEICYDNVQWIDRRAEPVRPDDPRVANFYGRLSFDLVGRFHERGETRNVFGFNFVSPETYHYLFAANSEEVREDSCPTEWVGTRIVTDMEKRGGMRVVPNRLTYLAGARNQPSEVIRSNWARGDEWRDWFATGLGVSPHGYPPDEGMTDRLNQHLQALHQAEQSELYAALLKPRSRAGRLFQDTLFERQEELTMRKALIRSYISLLYPDLLIDSDSLRASMEGEEALLDNRTLRLLREQNAAVSSINKAGLSRLERFQADWGRLPDDVRRSGTVSAAVAHALIRLDDLHQEFFREKETMVPRGLRG